MDYDFNQFVHFILPLWQDVTEACNRGSWLRRIKCKTAWCAYWVAVANWSSRYEVLKWILCQHFLLDWCQFSNKFHIFKTLQLGFRLYYIFFILVLIQLLHLLIIDLSLLRASLCNGLNTNGSNAVVILLLVSTVTDFLITSCFTSSLTLIISALECFL